MKKGQRLPWKVVYYTHGGAPSLPGVNYASFERALEAVGNVLPRESWRFSRAAISKNPKGSQSPPPGGDVGQAPRVVWANMPVNPAMQGYYDGALRMLLRRIDRSGFALNDRLEVVPK